jgi:integrase
MPPSAINACCISGPGARNSEVFKAKWNQFDLSQGTWTKKAHFTKQSKLHHTPLSEPALTLLKELNRTRGDLEYVFPNPETGKPYTTLKKAWKTICRNAGITNLRLYDIRHSFASSLINADVGLPTIGKLLGHTQQATTARYARSGRRRARLGRSLRMRRKFLFCVESERLRRAGNLAPVRC